MNKFRDAVKIRFSLIIGLMGLSLFLINCGSTPKKNTPQIQFAVVDSLLGLNYDVPKTGMTFRPPAGFTAMPDEPLKNFQEEIKQMVGDSEGIELQQFYSDSTNASWIMITSIRGLNLSSDTTAFVNKYRMALLEGYGNVNVKAAEYWIGDIYAKAFLVTDSLYMKHQLIALGKDHDALELAFVAPHQLYPQMSKYFESSIASIRKAQ